VTVVVLVSLPGRYQKKIAAAAAAAQSTTAMVIHRPFLEEVRACGFRSDRAGLTGC
jgi:hypothetical protein